jgi:hypothetical protein
MAVYLKFITVASNPIEATVPETVARILKQY